MKSGIPTLPIVSWNKPGMPEPSNPENTLERTDFTALATTLSFNAEFLNRAPIAIPSAMKTTPAARANWPKKIVIGIIRKTDPSDDIFLSTAVEGKASFVISGDRHLLVLKECQDVQIVRIRHSFHLIEEGNACKVARIRYDQLVKDFAGVVELADTLDSKSSEAYPSCGFKSHLRHHDSYLVSSRSYLANKNQETSHE